MISLLADLERHAAERPDAVAIEAPRRSYRFVELKALVDAAAERLRDAGIAPRQVVVVDLPADQEWIIDLALLRLATRSVSTRGMPKFGGLAPDAVIAAPGSAQGQAPITIEVDELWLAGAVATASAVTRAVDYARPDSIFRLMLTSGTTGTPRAAAYSVAAFEHRRLGLDGYWSDARLELDLMPLSTTGGFHSAAAALRHGVAYHAVEHINEETMRFAASRAIEVICGSPNQIATAIEVLAEHSIELPALEEIRMAGAAPSATLLRIIDERLGVAVRGVYGSTEGGGVTSRMLHRDDDPADVGRLLPGLDLQIVDELGDPVAPGAEGTVRYRGPGLAAGYFENGEVMAFPRGWFAPGDVGRLTPDGSLILSGRASEILNIAGAKVNPERVDAFALEFPGVRDAAAFGLERPNGIAELGIAVVGGPACDLRALDRRLRQQLPVGHPTSFWQVTEIPRNRMGKVERGLLAEAHARATS